MVTLKPISPKESHILQNMARFYVYDLSKECGLEDFEWALPEDGLYKISDLSNYIHDADRQAYFIFVGSERAGFILLNKATVDPETNWNVGEFFILRRFQGKGIGRKSLELLWQYHPGTWEVSVIPENKCAYAFWKRVISELGQGVSEQEANISLQDGSQAKRILFQFHNSVEESL